MLVVTEKIKQLLDKKDINQSEFARLIGYNRGGVSSRINGERVFPEPMIEKISNIFEISKDEIVGWILTDKYTKQTLKLTIKVKKEELLDNNKLILTSKIDEILQAKNMSRTQLSKLAKCDQSALNKMITGNKPISKTVLTKLSNALEIPEDEIQSWILADKYSLKALETAIKEKAD